MYRRISSKRISDLNFKIETIQFPEGNMYRVFCKLGLGKGFLTIGQNLRFNKIIDLTI